MNGGTFNDPGAANGATNGATNGTTNTPTNGGTDPDGNGGTTTAGGGTAMPCEVDTVVQSKCGLCHGATPLSGAPMPLVTLADFQRDYTVQTTTQLAGQTLKMYELARIRVNREMGTTQMPQGSPLADSELATLNDWLQAQAPAGSGCGSTDPGTAGAGGDDPVDPNDPRVTVTEGGRTVTDQCEDASSAFEPLVPREGETCYEFQVHGRSSPTDTSKFDIPQGESYNQFYYDVPWPRGTVATRFGARFDNLPVLHHWLGFTSTSPNAAGTVARNVTGTTIGENAELVGGWAVGGCNTEFPEDVGLRLPDSGRIMIQWHHYNSTGQVQMDGSAVQWCTVPASEREHIAGLTFLGTENFNGPLGMPPGVQSDFTTSCSNRTSEPITILGFTPHMHEIGVHMKSVVERPGMDPETVFDEPFIFDSQVNYMVDPAIVLQPGDTITTTCTFNNTTPLPVAFGQSTGQEMCYQFTLSYPYGALNNGVFSLIGATNTCW